jgi:hypothetical protein
MATTARTCCPSSSRPEREPLLRINRRLDRALRRLRRRLLIALEQSRAPAGSA